MKTAEETADKLTKTIKGLLNFEVISRWNWLNSNDLSWNAKSTRELLGEVEAYDSWFPPA